MTPPTILCCGEPLVVLTPHCGEDLVTAHELSIGVAGAELNVALHLARLGLDVRFAGAVGADPFGKRIRSALVGGGDRRPRSARSRGPAHGGLLQAHRLGKSATVAASTHHRDGSGRGRRWLLTDEHLTLVGHIHVSGVAAAVSEEFVARLESLTTPERTWTVSFDLNHRPALWPPGSAGKVLLHIARRCDIVLDPGWTRPPRCGTPRRPRRSANSCPMFPRSWSRTVPTRRRCGSTARGRRNS